MADFVTNSTSTISVAKGEVESVAIEQVGGANYSIIVYMIGGHQLEFETDSTSEGIQGKMSDVLDLLV